MDKDYFETSEKICWDKINDFNEHLHMFQGLDRTKGKWHSDCTGYTVNKLGERKDWNIELKNRFVYLLDNGKISGCSDGGKIYIEDNLFIESHKVADLFLDKIDGLSPLYVNFTLDGYTIIYNLDNLKKRPYKSDNKNIRSRGYQKFEMAKRQGLYISDAAIYDKDYNLVKKAGDEWIINK